jgi:hypothetical protein
MGAKMSHATLKHIMARIEFATKESPIAVFTSEFKGNLNAVFGSTIYTKQLIASGDKTYIGTFDKNGDLDAVKAYLDGFINK